jgi:DNA-binding LacI/PurR family transcriptional regulator
MATLKEVAAVAGVHITTVAAVLNGGGGNTRVGQVTRERVTEAAQRLGYVRNESARRLRTGKSNTVGFIGGDLRNPFFSELASALERELEGHQLQLMISHVSGSQSANLSHTVEFLRQQTVSKIIYWDESAFQTPLIARPEVQLLPIGFTIQPRPGLWLDLEHAMALAITHLVRSGFRTIGFFAPQGQRESPSVMTRQKMFVDECLRQGLPAPKCGTYEGESWNIKAAADGARTLLAQEPSIEAFVGFNDVSALGLLLAGGASERKPVVIGFDGTPLIRSWPTAPPFLDLKIAELARQAVATLVHERTGLLDGAKEHWLRPELIAGAAQ